MRNIKSHAISRVLLAALLAALTNGCGGGGSEGDGDDGGDSNAPPPAPTQAPNITIEGNQVTATWTAEPDTQYYINYGQSPEATTNTTWTFDNTSPYTFSINNEGMYYFRLVKVVNGLHSDPGPADMAPVLAKPELSLVQAGADSTVIALGNADVNASETVLYYGTTGDVNPENWTAAGTFPAGSDSQLTHTITDFVDDDYEPLTYRYVARSAYGAKSVSEVSGTIETTAGLARYRVYEVSDPNNSISYGPRIQDTAQYARADGGLFDVVDGTVYWLCPTQYANVGGFCHAPVVPDGDPADPGMINVDNTSAPWALAVEPDSSGDLVIYFLHKDGNGKVQPWRYRSGAAEVVRQLATLPNEEDAVAVLQDSAYLYITTETSICQIAKADIETTPGCTPLVSDRSDLRAPLIDSGKLYFADDAGIHYLAAPGGSTPTSVASPPADLLPVTSIAVADGALYYIANDDTDGVNSGQAIYKLASGVTTNLQNRLYNAAHLAYHNGDLVWLDNSKIYSMSADGGAVAGRISPKALGFAMTDSDRDLVFTMEDATQRHVYSIPPGYRFDTPAAPSAPSSLDLTTHDSEIELVADGYEKTEAVEVYVEADGVERYVGLDRANVCGLVNGTTATVTVVPVNISGPGDSRSSSATPTISWENAWESIGIDSDDGKIIVSGHLNSPMNQAGDAYHSRSLTFHVHRGTSPDVDTSGTPVTTETCAEGTDCRFTWEDTAPVNDGAFYYYNVLVEDNTFEGADVPNPTLSEPYFDAGMEIYSNAAKPVENLIAADASLWVSGHRYRMAHLNGSYYYTTYYSGGFVPPDRGFRFDGTTPAAFTTLDGYSLLATDGTNLYAVDPGATADYGLYKVSNIETTPTFEKLSDITDLAEYYEPTSLLYSGGYLYLSTKKGIVIKVDAANIEDDVLVHDHGFASYYPDNLTEANGKIYWTRASEIWAVDTSGGTAEKVYETSFTGSMPDLAITADHYYWKRPESWGGYYRAPIGAASGADESFSSGQGMAVDRTTGNLYWENGGDIFTLDGEGRHLAVCSRPPNEEAEALKFLEDGGLYSLGNGLLDRCNLP